MAMNNEQSQGLDHMMSCLFQSFIANASLQELVTLAAKLLGNPLVVIDLTYKILVHSSLEGIDDKIWIENLEKGYCPYEFIAKINTLQSVQEGRKDSETYKVICPESNNEKLVAKVMIGNQHIGNIILIGCLQSFKEQDYEVLSLIGKMIGQKLKRGVFYKSSEETIREEFIYDLLEHKYSTQIELKERMAITKLHFGLKLYLFVFSLPACSENYGAEHTLKEAIHDLFHLTYSVYYNDHIVLIFDKPLTKALIHKAQEFLQHYAMHLGISREFSNLLECRKYYLQALNALQIGKLIHPEKTIIHHYEVQYYSLLSNIDIEKDFLDYCHPSLVKLMEYDKKHHSNLYSTLYIYICNDGNIQKTAQDTFMHRNTVRYKINKIIDLTEIDFTNMQDVSNLFIGYRLQNYFEAMKRQQHS